jgi:asparagine synthase (glutamine-hydrolysing)
VEKNAKDLVPIFLEACKNRVDQNAKNLISLSGGLDSRAIAAGLHASKIPCYAVTSPEPNWRPVFGSLSETEIANQLTNLLNIECKNYDIMIPKAVNLLTLLKIKNGLVYLAHGFLTRYLNELREKSPTWPINLFTGHGGDVSFTNLSFDIPDIDFCVRGILRVKGRFPLHIIATLTKLKEEEIINEIRNILTSYPEKDPSLKLAHFLFFENNAKFSFEIEDVNRFYFWTVAPFYSVPFFKHIFNCSDKNKEKLALYREFLFAISPATAAISNSNWGCSILSKKFKILQYILYLSFKYPKLRRFIKRIYDKRAYNYKDNSKIIQCIRQQVRDCSEITNFLSSDVTEKILNDCSEYSHEGIDNLLTITSLMEETLCNRSTLNKYY